METVPDDVWSLNESIVQVTDTSNNETVKGDQETCWWELNPIRKLFLSSNSLRDISGQGLARLASITTLDLRDNHLTSLPEEISALPELLILNLSVNKLTDIPPFISGLNQLNDLQLGSNCIKRIKTGILGQLKSLQILGLENNQIDQLPDDLPKTLRRLNIQQNKLYQIPTGLIQSLTKLESLDISENLIENVGLSLDHPKQFCLISFHAHKNRLKELPCLAAFPNLKEIFLLFNMIASFDSQCLHGLDQLINLDLTNNSISSLPDDFDKNLPALLSLRLSNNDLNNLPLSLGSMPALRTLLVTGNPLRSIPSSVVHSGSDELIQCLRSRAAPPAPSSAEFNQQCDSSHMIEETSESGLPAANASGLLDWSAPAVRTRGMRLKNLRPTESLPLPQGPDNWRMAAFGHAEVTRKPIQVDLSRRTFELIPCEGLLALSANVTTLILVGCHIKKLEEEIDRFSQLSSLDLSRNDLSQLPASLSRLSQLVSLRLDNNPRLGATFCVAWSEQPIFHAPLSEFLEQLSLRQCRLTCCPPPTLVRAMPRLSMLDLADNDLTELPPELGLCRQLRSLVLDGNGLRVPRPAILAKGTEAVLDFLKGRIPE